MAHENLKILIPLVDALAETFGKNCEVVLHDLRNPEHSIIKIANNHLTGRELGSPATDFVLSLLNKKDLEKDYFVGYPTRAKLGNELKSTTVFIRNAKNKIIGALCINIDLTPYRSMRSILDEICFFSPGHKEKPLQEKFAPNTDMLISDALGQSIGKIGKPVGNLGKQEKLRLISELKKKGIFLIRGAAKRVSRELGVSLPTIYKYLEEINEV
jgi:predicted transcriptional regulator YheO